MMPNLIIKNAQIPTGIVQGGMGIGVSLAELAAAVTREGGLGTISSAGLDLLVSKRIQRKVDSYEAMRLEVELAKSLCNNGPIAVNIMYALQRDYADSVKGAIDAGVDVIVSGGGLPLPLPSIKNPGKTALAPIVSGERAAKIICGKWQAQGYRPDAIIVEGPKAGGHVCFDLEEIYNPEFSLENLFLKVQKVVRSFKGYEEVPIIGAGGITTKEDLIPLKNVGMNFFQMGSIFLGSDESAGSDEYKKALVECTKDDIILASSPGSPCKYLFRTLKKSPLYEATLKYGNQLPCNKGHVLLKDADGNFTKCSAKTEKKSFFCICNGLFSSGGRGFAGNSINDLYTVGAEAWRINDIRPVKQIMGGFKN